MFFEQVEKELLDPWEMGWMRSRLEDLKIQARPEREHKQDFSDRFWMTNVRFWLDLVSALIKSKETRN